MSLCNPATKAQEQRMKTMSDMYDYWQSKVNIVDRFTDIVNGLQYYNRSSSADTMKWFIEQRIGKPWDIDSPLKDSDFRRIKVEIDSFNKALGGRFGNFAFMVPEGISKKDPIARRFYTSLNEILDFERVNINRVLTDNGFIANHMLDAYLSEPGATKGKGNFAIKELRRLRQEMIEGDPAEHIQAEFVTKIEDFIAGKEGKTIRDFLDLVQMDDATFRAAKGKDFTDPNEGSKTFGQKRTYNSHVYEAVIKARRNLKNMSKVYVLGLQGLQKIISLKYTNDTNIKNARLNNVANRMIKTVQESIDDINKGALEGGYFPHVQFETILHIKDKLSKAMTSKRDKLDDSFSTVVDNIIQRVDSSLIPAHARKRNTNIEDWWEKDPMMVLKEYGDQAVQFNKMVNTQITYLDALKHLPTTNMEFQKGLRRFIEEEYTVFTMGTTGRPDWVNMSVLTLNAIQTGRTMGLNITGAVKNAASAMHFYSRVGFGSYRNAKKAIEHDTEFQEILFGKIDPRTGKRTMGVEEEAGFLFSKVAPELYTEGLITRQQMETGRVVFDPVKNTIKVDGSSVVDALKKTGRWSLNTALVFHRWTENFQRKWMFRTSFHMKYSSLVNEGYNKTKAKSFAKSWALEMVNGWAYEYAIHAKAKGLRGEWRTVEEIQDGRIVSKLAGVTGGMSEMAMHLLHYPMSLFESHYSQIKGAYKGILAKQGFDAPEIQWAARYAGVSGLIALGSVLLNADLSNIFEDETRERIKRVHDDIGNYDNPDKGTFGVLSEFTGTNLGTLKHLLISQGVIDIEHSDLNKILFGNVDFADDDDKLTEMYAAYQYSTAWGMLKNKYVPTLKSGRGFDVLRHILKFYPTEWTKKANQFIMGRESQYASKGPQQYDPNIKKSLDILSAIHRA